jgi:catechol 2,3-dioxygenase-like lactoylglutathione lyase family enzyme
MTPYLRRIAVAWLVLAVAGASAASAQLAPPNAAGVSMGHLHYTVKDVDANRAFWIKLGAKPVTVGSTEALKLTDVLVFLTRGESSGGTDGSVLNHVAFRVPSFADVEAAGLKMARLANFPGVGSVNTPEGERVELFENAATNLTFTQDAGFNDATAQRHNRPVTAAATFHHIHLYLPATAVTEAKGWYTKMFGGIPGKRSNYDATDLPGINFNFSAAPKPTVPTKGRMLDHLGHEVTGLEAFCKRLQGMGVTFDVPYTRGTDGVASATFTDPWGTRIELTEGLRQF